MFCIYKYSFKVLSSECPKGMQIEAGCGLQKAVFVFVLMLQSCQSADRLQNLKMYLKMYCCI